MERLKVAIADKILEISSRSSEEMKYMLGKIQRFNDFAEACKTLITKFPEIETELLEMVADDDFDASRASRKVDAIISREQTKQASPPDYQMPQIPESIPIITPPPATAHESDVSVIKNETLSEDAIEEHPEQYTHAEQPPAVEESSAANDTNKPEKEVIFSTISLEDVEGKDKKAKRKRQLTLLWQILAIAVVVFLVVIVVKFVVSYWKIILIVFGSLLVIYLLWVFLKKRNRKE